MKNPWRIAAALAVLAILGVLAMTKTGLAAPGRPVQVPGQATQPTGDFVEWVVVDYWDPSHAGPGPHPSSETNKFQLLNGGIKWLATGMIEYKIDNSNKPAAPSASDINAAVNAAVATWDTVVDPVSFSQDNSTPTSNPCGGDNRVEWASLGASTIAATAPCINPATKEIVGFRMVLNNDLSWSAGASGTGVSGEFDVQNIVAHEFGHAVGAGHVHAPKDGLATMYYLSGTQETIKRTLADGECGFAQAQYSLTGTSLATCLSQDDSGLTAAE